MNSLTVRYALGLMCAFIAAALEFMVVVGSLTTQLGAAAAALATTANLVALAVLVGTGTIAVAVGGYFNIARTVRWYRIGQIPTAAQRRAARNIVRRQFRLLAFTWAVVAAVLIGMNARAGVRPVVVIAVAAFFASTATVSLSLLFAQRILRPMVASAGDVEAQQRFPGVKARLMILWVLVGLLPSMATVLLVVSRANDWGMDEDASVDVPLVVIAFVAVLIGAPAVILVARSISDPVSELLAAMAAVRQGDLGVRIEISERSEIGWLQSGFNQMVGGLRERERIRDAFGRYVGRSVAQRAVETDAGMDGEVVYAAVLFVDLAHSTEMAASQSPERFARLLNEFFRIVVGVVDAGGGLINKFEGDAALAVFGAPERIADPCGQALSAARELAVSLGELPGIGFGIGVSAGRVFAGNIGAEDRHEFTVIGDPVNEAARLAELAKVSAQPVLASAAAVGAAGTPETGRWSRHGSQSLRGRPDPTEMFVPGPRGSQGHGRIEPLAKSAGQPQKNLRGR